MSRILSTGGGAGPGDLVPGVAWSGGCGPGGAWSRGVLVWSWGVPGPVGVPGRDPPGQPLLRAVRILLEYILVINTISFSLNLNSTSNLLFPKLFIFQYLCRYTQVFPGLYCRKSARNICSSLVCV